jgi:hypothetical protein
MHIPDDPAYFEKFYFPTGWAKKKRFRAVPAREGVLAVLPGLDGEPYIIDTSEADSPLLAQDLLAPEAQRPMTEQLLGAGFRPLPRAPGVFKYSSEEPSESLIAVVEGKRLTRLFTEASPDQTRQWPKHFRIVKVTELEFNNDKITEPYSELTITEGSMTYTISSSNSFGEQGAIVRKTRLVPLSLNSDKLFSASHWPEPKTEPNSNFIIGGKNTNDSIATLHSLNGYSISTLEDRLRPDKKANTTFLGKNESLLSVLMKDNEKVIKHLSLTHQKLAEVMGFVQNIWLQNGAKSEVEFSLEGRRYLVRGITWKGFVSSPFGDEAEGGIDLIVTNLENSAVLRYSGLMPDLIWRYGFYEGKGSPYRVEPDAIVKVFDFLVPKPSP